MNLYRLLYGTGPDGTYGTLSEDPGLRSFLLRDIGADTTRSVIERTMGVFGAFQELSDYSHHDRNNLPVMVRYAPMYLSVFPGMPLDIRPFCIVGASGNEGLSRNTTYTQMDFFSMDQLYQDPDHSYLDYLLGLQAFDRQNVDQIRSGRIPMPAPVLQKIDPAMRSQDKEHVLKAVSALFDQKLVVIRLEPGASFVNRAREILAQIYSLMPISYAAQVGYSIYQSPGAIQEVTKYWSFRIFVVPAEEYVDDTDPNLQYIDMSFSQWNNSSELNWLLKSMWSLPWEKRLLLLKALPPISNREEYLDAVRPLLEAAVTLDQWCSAPPAGSVQSLGDLWGIFQAHPQWKHIPWAVRSVKECLSTILKPDLTIEQLNARAYAEHYASGQQDPNAEKLLKFGQYFGSIDYQALCSYVDETAHARAAEKVQAKMDNLQKKNSMLDFELKDTKKQLTDTKGQLEKTTADLGHANDAVKNANEKLSSLQQKHDGLVHELEDTRTQLKKTTADLKRAKDDAQQADAQLQDVFNLVEPPVSNNPTVASWSKLKGHIHSLLLDLQQSNGYLQQLQIDPVANDAQTKVNELIATSDKLAEAKGYLSRVGIDTPDPQTAEEKIGQIKTLLQIEQVLAENGIPTQSEESVRTGLAKMNDELRELKNKNQQLNEAEKELSDQKATLVQQWAVVGIPEDWETQWNALTVEVVPAIVDETMNEPSAEHRSDTGNEDNDNTDSETRDQTDIETDNGNNNKDGNHPAFLVKLRPFLPWLLVIPLAFVIMVLSLKGCEDIGPTGSSTAPSSSASVPETTSPSESTETETTAPPATTAPPETTAPPAPVAQQTVVSFDPNTPVECKADFEDWNSRPYDKMRNALKVGKNELKFEQEKINVFFTNEACDLIPEVSFALDDAPVQNKPFAVLLRPKDDCTSSVLPDDANAVICCGSNVIAVYEGNSSDTDNVDELTLTAIRFMCAMLEEGQMQIQPKLFCLKDDNGVWIDHGVKIRELTGDPDWFYNITDFTADEKACESLKDKYQLPAVPMLSLESEKWHIMILEGDHDATSVNKVVGGTQTDCDGLFILCKPKDTASE